MLARLSSYIIDTRQVENKNKGSESEEEKFECKVCQQTFAFERLLDKHRKTPVARSLTLCVPADRMSECVPANRPLCASSVRQSVTE